MQRAGCCRRGCCNPRPSTTRTHLWLCSSACLSDTRTCPPVQLSTGCCTPDLYLAMRSQELICKVGTLLLRDLVQNLAKKPGIVHTFLLCPHHIRRSPTHNVRRQDSQIDTGWWNSNWSNSQSPRSVRPVSALIIACTPDIYGTQSRWQGCQPDQGQLHQGSQHQHQVRALSSRTLTCSCIGRLRWQSLCPMMFRSLVPCNQWSSFQICEFPKTCSENCKQNTVSRRSCLF